METSSGRLEVMVIEPEPYYRVSATYFLSRMGCVVTDCWHCSQARNLIRKRAQGGAPLALIVVDLGDTSLAMVQSLRLEGVLTPVVLTTPCPSSDVIRRSMSLQHTAVLLKPYSFEELARVMAQLQYPSLYQGRVSLMGGGSQA